MKKMYKVAPLPFVGQKRNFVREFIKVLDRLPDDVVFVDLFGGSGLLSHVAKRHKPQSRVIYNDYDCYRDRLAAIPSTNAILRELRAIVADIPAKQRIVGDTRERVIDCLNRARKAGTVDYITLSTALLFSGRCMTTHESFIKETFYNRVRGSDIESSTDYLEGIEVRSCDYRVLVKEFEGIKNVVFLVDPPYLSTDVSTYTMSWRLSDCLDVLTILANSKFVYFTSNKSSIVELCDWMGKHSNLGNPFEGCARISVRAHINHTCHYEDIMLFNAV